MLQSTMIAGGGTRMVLEILESGMCSIRHIHRSELLCIANATTTASSGGAVCTLRENAAAAAGGGLLLRDLRAFESKSGVPTIIVRDRAVLVNLFFVQGIVFPDRFLVFLPSGSDELIHTVQTTFQDLGVEFHQEHIAIDDESKPPPESTAFELYAFECLIASALVLLRKDYLRLKPLLRKTASRIVATQARDRVHQMKILHDDINRLVNMVQSIHDILTDLIDDEDRMQRMHFSYVNQQSNIDDQQHDFEVERVLDYYLQRVGEYLFLTSELQYELQTYETKIGIQFSLHRNKFIFIDTLLQIILFLVTVGVLGSGYFAMNLSPTGSIGDGGTFPNSNNQTEYTTSFAVVTGLLTAIIIFGSIALFYCLFRLGLIVDLSPVIDRKRQTL